MELRVVLVEPHYDGNMGSVARAMKNFGFSNLVMVNPGVVGDFGRAMASHAREILEGAKVAKTIEEAVKGADLVVGTTGKRALEGACHLRLHVREPFLTPFELARKMEGRDGTLALLLGREDWGLTNDELMLCDLLVSIPTSDTYPVMNLSHAATILFYELSMIEQGSVKLASGNAMNRICTYAERIMSESLYPPHKIRYVTLMLRRIFGRACLTEREANTIQGIFKKVLWKISRSQEIDKGTNEKRDIV